MNIYVFDLDDTCILHRNQKVNYETIKYNKNIDFFLSSLNGPKYIYTNGTYGHIIRP